MNRKKKLKLVEQQLDWYCKREQGYYGVLDSMRFLELLYKRDKLKKKL